MSDPFQAFAQEYAVYGYPVLFAGVLLENAGVPVPGETAVLVAGFLASPAGGGHFHLPLVILLTVVAAVLGDNLGFWLGHRLARPRLQSGRRFLFLTPATLQMAEGYFERYGLWTIFFARFITGLRVVAALAAGTAGMHWTRFFIANTCGALAWASGISLLGYFFGQSWQLLHVWLGRGGLILLGCVIVLVGLPYLLRRLRHMPVDQWERLARAQVWQGVLAAVLEVVCIALLVLLAQGHHATPVDRHVQERIESHPAAVVDALAVWGSRAGMLPVHLFVTGSMLGWLRYQGRSWRESAAILWALLASEAVGLLLIGLLRARHVEPLRVESWPAGFAGLIPLRSLSVLGMSAYLFSRPYPQYRWAARVLAALLVLWGGFSVVWSGDQLVTEVLLEYAAGGVVLFAGVWWLEGYYGPGLAVPPAGARS